MPLLSLIVPTLNRESKLRQLLDSLKAQSSKNFEVLIVNQGNPNTVDELSSFYTNDFIVHSFHVPKKGAARARNFGIDHAKGELLGFPDDDCCYDPKKVEWVVQYFSRNEDVDCITGVAVNQEKKLSLTNFSRHDLASERVVTSHCTLKFGLEPTIFLRKKSLGPLRFDPDMGVGADSPWQADEGPDLLNQLLDRGSQIRFVPENLVIHEIPEEVSNSRALKYARGRGYFFRKRLFLLPNLFPLYFKAMIGLILSGFSRQSKHYFRILGYTQGLFNWKLDK